jgi:putative oxidoreductase
MKKKVELGARIVLGTILFVFGLNKFLNFIPQPEASQEMMNAFGNLMALGFIMPTVAIVEVIVGLALLTNKFKSLALVVLVPISYGMVAFHLAFDIQGIGMAAFVAILNIYLLAGNKEKFNSILIAN